MMLWLDVKYSKLVGPSLERFRICKEQPFLAVARCPICGDSQKNKYKTRFYIYQKEYSVNVLCHNCNYSTTLPKFLKDNYTSLFNDYVFEKFRDSKEEPTINCKHEERVVLQLDTLDLVSVDKLQDDHPAKKYLKSRKLLGKYDFKFAPRFNEFSSQYVKELNNDPKKEHPRIIIEYKTKSGKIFCYQGRSITEDQKIKYKTIVLPGYEETPKIFGLDRLKLDEKIYVVEGPLDSLFIKNCIASTNAALKNTADRLLKSINTLSKKDVVLVLDNEPRNAQVLKQYETAINAGYQVVIWPEYIKQKDINEMIMENVNPKEIIDNNTYSGLMALHQFSSWKKT